MEARVAKRGQERDGALALTVKAGGGWPGPLGDEGHPRLQFLDTQPVRRPPLPVWESKSPKSNSMSFGIFWEGLREA